VKQRKHESAAVSFCDPVQSTGDSKQTIKFYYFWIVPIHPRLQRGAFSAPAGQFYYDQGTGQFKTSASQGFYQDLRLSDECV
jgi:hypothetical protein